MIHMAMPSPKNFFPWPLMRKVSTEENDDVPSCFRLHTAPFLLWRVWGAWPGFAVRELRGAGGRASLFEAASRREPVKWRKGDEEKMPAGEHRVLAAPLWGAVKCISRPVAASAKGQCDKSRCKGPNLAIWSKAEEIFVDSGDTRRLPVFRDSPERLKKASVKSEPRGFAVPTPQGDYFWGIQGILRPHLVPDGSTWVKGGSKVCMFMIEAAAEDTTRAKRARRARKFFIVESVILAKKAGSFFSQCSWKVGN